MSANKLYRRGRHGSNVIRFEHPTRRHCDVTGNFYDAAEDSLPLYYICNSTGAYACASNLRDAKIRLAECKLKGIKDLIITRVA